MEKKCKKEAWEKLSRMLAHYNKWTRFFGIEEIWYDTKKQWLTADCEISRKVLAQKETVFSVIRGIIGFKYLNHCHGKITRYIWNEIRMEENRL